MKRISFIVLLAFATLVFSCKRDAEIPVVSYATGDVNAEAFQTTCVITCKNESVDGASIRMRALIDKDKNFSSAIQQEMTAFGDQWRCDVSGLTHGTKYYYCFELFSDVDTYRLKEVYDFSTSFVTGISVTTSEVTEITQTTARGGGSATTDSTAITERGICWSTSHNPTTSNSHAHNGTGEGSYTVNMTGLNANTTYYVRAYAINSLGTTYGDEVSFTTLRIVTKPTVTTSQVTNITQTSATCGGNVTSDGDATVTDRGVCWGTSHNPTTSNSHANSGTGTGSFTVNMTGLTANTNYYARAYATNSIGTAYGEEVSFITTSQQTNYTISVSASPSSGGTVSGGGTYQQGQSCTVRAVANSGYSFAKWTENGTQVSTNANYTFTVNGNRSLVANFTSNSQNYTITVSANPSNGGSVSGGGTYQQGQSCTVRAVSNNSYSFSKWTENGSEVSTNANYTFTVNSNRTLVAHFNYNGGGGHEYVNLGLPSGRLWATCNVGAASPEENGDSFAWGEIQSKNVYNWNNYQHCMGSMTTLTKYCHNSSFGYNGYTDNLVTLQSGDDAATAKWGVGWRMPTKDEWMELYNNTTATSTTQNGVSGRLFTGTNGNSIFIPNGNYWSSSLATTNNPPFAWYFVFNYYTLGYNTGHRSNGYSVRAVR